VGCDKLLFHGGNYRLGHRRNLEKGGEKGGQMPLEYFLCVNFFAKELKRSKQKLEIVSKELFV
jgi:hypothetical protein